MSLSSKPIVSIVLPTLNGQRFITQSIESCLSQSFADFELIIVDGGSTDDTVQIARAFRDARIKVVFQPDNVDLLPGALNYGFANAVGEYYTWFQDDDYYAPKALETLVQGLCSHPDAGMVYTGMSFVDSRGAICRDEPTAPPEALVWTNPIGCCFMYRRVVADVVGKYDPKFYMSEDTHYWLRIYKRSKIVHLPGKYYFHRLHPSSLTVKNYGAFRALRVAAKARREVLGMNWLKYQRQLSNAFVEEAFCANQLDDGDHVLDCLMRGVIRNPAWLANRGIWSIGWSALWRRPVEHD